MRDIIDGIIGLIQYYWYHLVMTVLLLMFAAGIIVALEARGTEHEEFMQQCMEDHKEYECTAMWRA